MSRRFLVAVTSAHGATGGIESFNRLLLRAVGELEGDGKLRREAIVLTGGDTPDARGFGGSRARFTAAYAGGLLRFRPTDVVLGHIHLARLEPLRLLLAPRSRLWLVTHGIEVWRRLPRGWRAALSRAHVVTAVSEHTRGQLCRWNVLPADHVRLLRCALDPAWLDLARERQSVPAGPPRLLSVARLAAAERYKGIDAVLEALPAVRQAVPEVRYDVVGDGDDRPRLEEGARRMGVSDIVTFHGRCTRDSLAALYAGAFVFVLPSTGEGFGIVHLEAAAFSLPSVAGRFDGANEFVRDGETGVLVDPGDRPALAEALAGLLRQPERARALGIAARERLRSGFTYEAFRRSLEGLVEDAGGAA